jgi:hypothetical protein
MGVGQALDAVTGTRHLGFRVLIFFIAGLLFYLRLEHVDNLGAYSSSRPETGLLIPSVYDSHAQRCEFCEYSAGMRKAKIAAALIISGVLSLPIISVAQTKPTESNNEHGSVCVLPNSPEPPTRISPGGEYNPKTLTLRIDDREPIHWPHKEPVLIEGLDLIASHLTVLTSDGKRIQSFRFKFSEEDDAKLCIYFDGYQGVQLGSKKNADWCRVKVRTCWR